MENKGLRVLMIGAHPDDCELKTGGIAIKYRSRGHTVKFVSATMGDAGHHEQGGNVLARRREKEAQQAAALVGIESQVLDISDLRLVADLATREKFITLIREFRPDLIFTHRPNDYHPDHRYTSLLVQDSSYAVIVPNVLPLVAPLSTQPVIVYMNDFFTRPNELRPDVVLDIDDVFDTKLRMIHCHTSQMYEWLPWTNKTLNNVPQEEDQRLQWLSDQMQQRFGRTAERFRSRLIETYGESQGNKVRCAEAFEISEYGRQLDEEEWNTYFPLS